MDQSEFERVNSAESVLRVTLCLGIFLLPLVVSTRIHDASGIPKLLFLSMLAAACSGAALYLVLVSKKVVVPAHALPLFAFPAVFVLAFLFAPIEIQALWGAYRRIDGLATLLLLLFMLACMLQLRDRRQALDSLITTLTLSGTVLSIYGIFQYFGYDLLPVEASAFESSRSSATLGNPDFLAAYLAILLPFSLFYVLVEKRQWMIIVFALQTATIAMTGTRAGMIAAGAAIIALFIYSGRRKACIALSVLFLLVFAGVSLVSSSSGKEASDPVVRLSALADPEKGSFAERLEILKTIPPAVMEHPFLGAGPGAFRSVFEKHMTPGFVSSTRGQLTSDNAHNLYAQYAVELGSLGLLTFLWFLAWMLLRARSFLIPYRSVSDPSDSGAHSELKKYVPFLLAALITFVVNMLFGILTIDTAFLFWVIVGIFALVSTPEREARSNSGTFVAAVTVFTLITICSLLFYISARSYFEADLSYQKSQILLNESRYEDAELYARDAAKLFPAQRLYQRAQIYVLLEQASDPTRALDRSGTDFAYKKLSAFVPLLNNERSRDLDSFALSAKIQLAKATHTNDMELARSAVKTLEQGLFLNEYWLNGWILKSSAEYSLGEYENALFSANAALRLDPKNKDAIELKKLAKKNLQVRSLQR